MSTANTDMIINTPDYSIMEEICIEDSGEYVAIPSVYEPAEDTFLMLDALQMDLQKMVSNRLSKKKIGKDSSGKCGPLLVVELGSGFGLLIAAISKTLKENLSSILVGAHCIAVDINPTACHKTIRTCQLNDVEVDVVRGDLLTWMRRPEPTDAVDDTNKELYGPVDIMLFNPPYVRGFYGERAQIPRVSKFDPNDPDANDLELAAIENAAWLGGGPYGIEVLNRALFQAADLLSEYGVFYTLMIDYNFDALLRNEMQAREDRDDNSINDTVDNFRLTTFGSPLLCTKLISRLIPGELLTVYRISRPIDIN